jgi:hypothetical protein
MLITRAASTFRSQWPLVLLKESRVASTGSDAYRFSIVRFRVRCRASLCKLSGTCNYHTERLDYHSRCNKPVVRLALQGVREGMYLEGGATLSDTS